MRKGDRAILAQEQRVGDTSFAESTRPQQAAIAAPARRAVLDRIVTAVGQAVVDAECEAAPDDVGLTEVDKWRLHAKPSAFDAGAGRKIRQALERGNELGPAIGVTRIVQGVDADDEVVGAERFGPAQRDGPKNRF